MLIDGDQSHTAWVKIALGYLPEEIRTLRDQITCNFERAWGITGRSEDELTGVMVQISQVVAKQLSDKK